MLGNFLDDANAQLRQLQREAAEQVGEAQDALMEQIDSLQKTINRELERIRQKESLKRQMEARVSSEITQLKSNLSSVNQYLEYNHFMVYLQGRLVGELDGQAIEALNERVFRNIMNAGKAENEFHELIEGISMANWFVRNTKGLY